MGVASSRSYKAVILVNRFPSVSHLMYVSHRRSDLKTKYTQNFIVNTCLRASTTFTHLRTWTLTRRLLWRVRIEPLNVLRFPHKPFYSSWGNVSRDRRLKESLLDLDQTPKRKTFRKSYINYFRLNNQFRMPPKINHQVKVIDKIKIKNNLIVYLMIVNSSYERENCGLVWRHPVSTHVHPSTRQAACNPGPHFFYLT